MSPSKKRFRCDRASHEGGAGALLLSNRARRNARRASIGRHACGRPDRCATQVCEAAFAMRRASRRRIAARLSSAS
ncbi:hypothetical protein [Burkholderia pseudomallei]